VKYKSKLYFTGDEPAEPQRLSGSFLAFTLNGQLQGKAYTELREGTYYPSLSLYTHRRQQNEPAAATVNFGVPGSAGGGFAFPPPAPEALGGACPPPQPACEMAGPRPVPAAAQKPPPQQQVAAGQQQQQQQQQQQPQPVPPEQQPQPMPAEQQTQPVPAPVQRHPAESQATSAAPAAAAAAAGVSGNAAGDAAAADATAGDEEMDVDVCG
jgi:outer membrane biosynthesis protein TonB